MSDFDAVLERLLTDPAFAAALAADPAAALAGYRLDSDEVRLLHTQVGADPGAQRRSRPGPTSRACSGCWARSPA